jgi:hypothetical protein
MSRGFLQEGRPVRGPDLAGKSTRPPADALVGAISSARSVFLNRVARMIGGKVDNDRLPCRDKAPNVG